MSKIQMDFGELGGGGGLYGEPFTPSTSDFTIKELGFVPTKVIMWGRNNGTQTVVNELDVPNSKIYQWYTNLDKYDATNDLSAYIKVEGTKLYYKARTTAWQEMTYYVAIKE